MKSLATFAIAVLLPFATHAQEESGEIADLKRQLQVSEAEKKKYEEVFENFAEQVRKVLGPNVTLDEIPDHLRQAGEKLAAQGAQLDELTIKIEFLERKNNDLLKVKEETEASLNKLGADVGKALKQEDGLPLEQVPRIIAELVEKNNVLRKQAAEMQVEIESLKAELQKPKGK